MNVKRKELDKLATVLQGIPKARLTQVLEKRERINLRVSESDKEGIKQTAALLGLTVTEYLLRLHSFAFELLQLTQ